MTLHIAKPSEGWPTSSASSPSALFSPSKARAQQAQARDWAAVDAWLGKIYHARHHQVPHFERNEETLQVLLTLAALNEEADEMKSLTARVGKAALSHEQQSRGGWGGGALVLLEQLTAEGEGSRSVLAESGAPHDRGNLRLLAELSLLLESEEMMAMARRMRDLTSIDFELGQQLRRAEYQRQALRRNRERITSILADLKREQFQPPAENHEDMAEWTRSSRSLRAKLTEYDDRLAALRSQAPPSPSIEEVIQARTEARQLQHRLDEVKMELTALRSLPSERKVAQLEIQRAKDELQKHRSQRQALSDAATGNG